MVTEISEPASRNRPTNKPLEVSKLRTHGKPPFEEKEKKEETLIRDMPAATTTRTTPPPRHRHRTPSRPLLVGLLVDTEPLAGWFHILC